MHFLTYGCTVQADRVIPGLMPARGEASEILITFDASQSWCAEAGPVTHSSPGLLVRRLDAGYHLVYDDGTEFLLSFVGDRIAAATPPGATLADTCTYLVGPVMGFALRLRGVVCLHASTVLIGGQAIAVCGAPGAGKSTTAAGFAWRGYPVLAEDVAALEDRGQAFSIQSGYPRVNLWPESAAVFCKSGDTLPAITPSWEKRYLPLNGPACFHPVAAPLAAVYILGSRASRSCPEVRELSGLQALLALASNTYTPYLLDAPMRAREFEVLRRLVAHVPIRQVQPVNDLARLGELCDAILLDYSSLAKAA